MFRKAYIVGIVTLTLSWGALRESPAYGRLVLSARNFRQNYCELQKAGSSLGIVERVVFSLSAKTASSRRS
jgi:hypothetical protein